ncbi:MAG: pectin esterase, partial [Alistipes sp.]|nr:pectin esterase [Alistipes sp.]
GEHITPEGWELWSNKENPTTVFYAEYGSKGKGGKTKGRVAWSEQLTKREAQALIDSYVK